MNDEAISPRELLRTAAQATGGDQALAALLETEPTELEAWLEGTRAPSFGTCFGALAIFERPHQQLGVLDRAGEADMPRGGSLERFARQASITSLLLTVGLFLFGLMTLNRLTKLMVDDHEAETTDR